ncbi:MAG TPA: hypothetical protein VGK23_03445 [Methanomassiliicoccales archaeon]|jgi:hypothetical protein
MDEEKPTGIIRGFLRDRLRPFVEITEKYKTPRIKMTKQVKWALLLLRLYLIGMLLLLAFKFFTSI